MKNIIITILICLSNITLRAQGVLNVTAATITPGPMVSVANGGTATFSFIFTESVNQPVPYIEGRNANISITLTYNSLVDSLNSITGYEPYFAIAINPYATGTKDQTIFLSQVQDIPADTYLEIIMEVMAKEDSGAPAPKNGGAVSLEPAGTQSTSGASHTNVYTYTCYKPIGEYAEGSSCYQQILPIELLSFTASARDNNVDLDWKTATELNNSHFEVQRSADGRNFESIGRVAGNGTTSEVISYAFTDQDPYSGQNYYRLKQVDYDGSYDYSRVKLVNFNENSALKVYPNPTTAGSEIHIQGQKIRTVQIYNMLGQLVVDRIYDQPLSSVIISSSNLAQGIYTTRVNGVDEKRVVIK